MNFDDTCYDLIDKFSQKTPLSEAKRGRPKSQAKLYQPSEKAFEIGYTTDSVEGRILQFLEEKPATMEELVNFLRQNFDEYNAVSACKEKIRQMLLDDVLDFAPEALGSDKERDVPALDANDDDEIGAPDLMQHIGGAYHDYQRSLGSHLSDY